MCVVCVCVVDCCVVVRRILNKNEKCLLVIPAACKCTPVCEEGTRTSTLTCSRSSFYLWCTQTKKHSPKIQREQNGESCGVCARVEKERENAKGRGQRTDRQRDRESKKCGRKSRNLRVKSVHIEER